MRTAFTGLLAMACLILLATPAYAGEEVKGKGWEITLPDGFVETLSLTGSGKYNVSSRFSTLPVEGVPEIKMYAHGDAKEPSAVLVISRIDLSRPVTTSGELGMDQLDQLRERIPVGMVITATKVGKWDAVEMSVSQEDGWDATTMRVICVAAGDYCVTAMLLTKDESYTNGDAVWSDVKRSMKIDPPMNRWLLFGLIGFAAFAALYFLNRVGTKQVREIPDHAGRWQRPGDEREDAVVGGLAAHRPMQTGVRPKVLPSSGPRFDPDALDAPPAGGAPKPPPVYGEKRGQPDAPPSAAPRTMPAPAPTSPAVTRPDVGAPPARKGLRPTRPVSGQWGH